MKTIHSGFFKNSFCKAFFFAAIAGMVSVNNLVAMPGISRHEHLYDGPTYAIKPHELRIVSYSLENSSTLVVNLENLAKERIKLQILNSNNEVVYSRELGKPEKFIGKFNLQLLANDNYTLVVTGAGQKYSKSFSLRTITTRVVKQQEPGVNQAKQEVI